jgi:hypothetical protein
LLFYLHKTLSTYNRLLMSAYNDLLFVINNNQISMSHINVEDYLQSDDFDETMFSKEDLKWLEELLAKDFD